MITDTKQKQNLYEVIDFLCVSKNLTASYVNKCIRAKSDEQIVEAIAAFNKWLETLVPLQEMQKKCIDEIYNLLIA